MRYCLALLSLASVAAGFPAIPGPINGPFGTPSQAIFSPNGGSFLQRTGGQLTQAQLIPANSEMVAKVTGGKGRCKVYYYCCLFYCWSKWTPCGCYLLCADREQAGSEMIPVQDNTGVTDDGFFDPPSPTRSTPPRADIPPVGNQHGGYEPAIEQPAVQPSVLPPLMPPVTGAGVDKVTNDDEREPEVIPNDNNLFTDQDLQPIYVTDSPLIYPPVQYEDEPDPYEWHDNTEPIYAPEYVPFESPDAYDTHPYPETDLPYIEEEPFYPEEEAFRGDDDFIDNDDTLIAFGQLQGRKPLLVRFPQTGVSYEARARSADQGKHVKRADSRLPKRRRQRKSTEQQVNEDQRFSW